MSTQAVSAGCVVTQIGDGQIQAPANAGCTAVQTVTASSASGSVSRVASTPVAAVGTSSAASSTSTRPAAFTGAASINKPAVAVVAGLMGLAALF